MWFNSVVPRRWLVLVWSLGFFGFVLIWVFFFFEECFLNYLEHSLGETSRTAVSL